MNDTNLNELLAFELGRMDGMTLEEWQDSLERRTCFRQAAQKLGKALEASGLRVRVGSTPTVEARLKFIRTWQPRAAYELTEIQAEPHE